ncbi:MAG TPA: S8 family serine peptidase [Thermoanaerobaculia bacterium]
MKPTPPSASPAKKGAPAAPEEPTDFYDYDGQRIALSRSRTEVVIRLRAGETASAVAGSLPDSASISEEIRTEGRPFRIVNSGNADGSANALAEMTDQLRASGAVEMVAGVFRHLETDMRMLGTDEIVVKLRPGMTRGELADRAAAAGLAVDRMLWGTTDEFVLRLNDPKSDDAVRKAQLLHESEAFRWVEPHFIRDYKKFATPSDPRFSNQWHLNNTGQGGGVATSDVDAVAAWNVETGKSNVVIAVVDDGVQKAHEDLAANIFVNPGEIANNGLDDDHNGYVDDVSGWDFSNNDNNADPFDIDDAHGTAVAGVAAARGNNGIGVTGACQTCRILPVKIFSPDFAGDVAVANALRYAASFADVVNNSWGGGPPSATLQSAIQTGTTNGRGGRGSAVMFSTGNSASGNFWISGPSLPAGTHRFRWTYSKDSSVHSGEDAVWVSWAAFPGSPVVNFEAGALPAGWSTGGNSSWSVVTDPRHSDEGVCYTKAAKSGSLGHSQSNWIQAVKTIPAGNFLSYQWVSSEGGYDGLVFEIDLNNNGSIDLWTDFISGVPFINTGVSYPAAHPESIAVGASSNFDCRSHYSQYGAELAFVAPSSAGPLNLRIESTDRTGANGYDPGNYTQAGTSSGFGGTSSASPLAAGVAGLLLSRNPNLTQAQVKSTLQNGADKVGSEPYVGGRNNRYGYGRINALQSLQLLSACGPVTLTPYVVPNGYTSTPYSLSFVAGGGAPGYTYAVTVGTLPPGLTLSSAGVLSGTPTTLGTYSFSVRATDTVGCTGYRAVNMVVTTAPPLTGRSFYLVTPCRVVDSRNPNGPSGGPAIANGATRDLQFTGVCGIPHTASAVVVNVTAVNPLTTGFMALYPTGTIWPGTTTISTRQGKTRANNAIIRLANTGQATIRNSGLTQHFIIDVTGYFQ